MASVLIIDDEEVFAKNAAKFLGKAGHSVSTALNARLGLEGFAHSPPDVVVLDFRLPDADGITVIQKIRALDAGVPILMITGHGSIELAVEAMKAGASDLLTKPVSLAELRQRVDQFAEAQRESRRLRYFESRERQTAHSILGDSPVMLEMRQRLARIASVEADASLPPVLILGETGTGKELVARALHFDSARASQAFIELNCAAIPDNLLESELFGHERGAFTDARERKIGLLEAADGGTLFLDEIGEMNLGLQAKLLKVIEDGRIRRLGAVQERQVKLRIVAATNQDLEERIRLGAFRADLFFRLRVLQLRVPPLRERGEDGVVLARHFLADFGRRYRRGDARLSGSAEAAIRAHRWPGNVRELRNVIEQAVLLSGGLEIGPQDLMLPEALLAPAVARETPPTPSTDERDSLLDKVEKELLVQALARSAENVSKAARELGISRDTLRYRMEKHGLR
jgi:DNA-binding NtrC family response regulator